MWFGVVMLACLVGACGPCRALHKAYDTEMRHQLRYLSLDNRVLWSGPSHGELQIGNDVMQSISANALKEHDSYKRTMNLRVPSEVWGYSGTIRLDIEMRFNHVDPGNKNYPWRQNDTALNVNLMLNAHFDVPGHRARWSWHGNGVLRVPIFVENHEGNTVNIMFENAELETIDANLPWEPGRMPEHIDDIVFNGIAAGIDAIVLEHQDLQIPIMEIDSVNLSNMSLPVRLKSAHFDPDTRVLMMSVYTALRPIWGNRARNQEESQVLASDDGIAIRVPVAVLNAALRQQSLRGAMPTRISLSSQDAYRSWSALWKGGGFRDQAWVGTWSAWCFEGDPCEQVDLQSTMRAKAEGGELVLTEEPMRTTMATLAPTDPGPATLSQLQRATLRDIVLGIVNWVEREDALGGMHMTIDAIQMDRGFLDATFSIQ